ncbi:hypothetical protein ACLOAV_010536 [Pseudogymnoascus australis]
MTPRRYASSSQVWRQTPNQFQPQPLQLQPQSCPFTKEAPPPYVSPYLDFNEAAERVRRFENHEALVREQKAAETKAQKAWAEYREERKAVATKTQKRIVEAQEAIEKLEAKEAKAREAIEKLEAKEANREWAMLKRKVFETEAQARHARQMAARYQKTDEAQRFAIQYAAELETRKRKLEERSIEKEARKQRAEERAAQREARRVEAKIIADKRMKKREARENEMKRKAHERAVRQEARRIEARRKAKIRAVRQKAQKIEARRKAKIRAAKQKSPKTSKMSRSLARMKQARFRVATAKKAIQQYEGKARKCNLDVVKCTENLLTSEHMTHALKTFIEAERTALEMDSERNYGSCTLPGAWRGNYTAAKLIPFIQRWQGLNANHFRNAASAPTLSPLAMEVARATFCPTHHRNVHSLCTYAFTAWSSASLTQLQDYARGLLQASHLCANGGCNTPEHIVLEFPRINMSRRNCERIAIQMREAGTRIPSACNSHFPPCLLRESALTRQEILVTAFVAVHKLDYNDITIPLEDLDLIGAFDPKLGDLPEFEYSYFHIGNVFPADFGMRKGRDVVPFWQS